MLALVGLAIGLPCALAASRLIGHLLFGVSAYDPATLGLLRWVSPQLRLWPDMFRRGARCEWTRWWRCGTNRTARTRKQNCVADIAVRLALRPPFVIKPSPLRSGRCRWQPKKRRPFEAQDAQDRRTPRCIAPNVGRGMLAASSSPT